MKGFGNSIVGTQIKAVSRSIMLRAYWKVLEPIIGSIFGGKAPPLSAMSIMFEMMEGALYSMLVKSVVHLAMIIKSM